jgi:hypothetical protein
MGWLGSDERQPQETGKSTHSKSDTKDAMDSGTLDAIPAKSSGIPPLFSGVHL